MNYPQDNKLNHQIPDNGVRYPSRQVTYRIANNLTLIPHQDLPPQWGCYPYQLE